jgi:hypothetical protein
LESAPANLAGSLATSNQTLTARIRTWRPSIVQPGWTIFIRDIRDQESKLGREKFRWASATPRECRVRRPQSSAPGGNEFVLTEYRSIPSCSWMEMRANGTMRDPQDEYDSDHKKERAQPSLHGDSASRARCRFRSLFNSASSRKHSCSFCQAATPSRVASSAPFGT